MGHYLAFRADFAPIGGALTARLIGPGLFYSVTILAILGCHELGHYFACRYYDVDASLPFFLPVPVTLTGTLGAFIRIREPIPTKRMLFDIGIAGPLAGFAVAVPALLLGISLSHVVKLPADFSGFELGEPLLFKLVSWLTWGSRPRWLLAQPPSDRVRGVVRPARDGVEPVSRSGSWTAATSRYAVLGRRSTYVTIVMVMVAIALSFVSAELDRLDGPDDRDAVRLRPATPPDLRRGRAARPRAPLDGARRAHHLRAVLHAGADLAVRSNREIVPLSEQSSSLETPVNHEDTKITKITNQSLCKRMCFVCLRDASCLRG